MKKYTPHTLINVTRLVKLADFGVIDPFTGKVYDSLSNDFYQKISNNTIVIDIAEDFKNSFNEILFLLPEIHLN